MKTVIFLLWLFSPAPTGPGWVVEDVNAFTTVEACRQLRMEYARPAEVIGYKLGECEPLKVEPPLQPGPRA